jgi:hypothetical protein
MCWFYKQGKLKFLEKKSLQSSYRERGGSLSGKSDNIFRSAHGGSTGYIESSAGSELSLPSKNWDNQQMWASLTHTPTMGRKVKPVSTPVAPPLPTLNNKEKALESDSQESLAKDTSVPVLSSYAQRGRRTTSTDEPPRGRRPTAANGGQSKRNYDNQGYSKDYYNKENERNIKKETNIDDVFVETTEQTGGILHELKRELSRRQSMKEMKTESETSDKKSAASTEGPACESTPRTSRRADGLLDEKGPSNKSKYAGIDQQSEAGEPDKIVNPMLRTNPAIRASVSSLRSKSDESPGSKRKKRKKKYVGVHKHPSKGKGDNLESNTDSVPDNSFDSVPPVHLQSDDGPLPPEALAPVFATDASVMQHFYPPQQNYHNQMNDIVLLGYDAYGNAVYGNPQHYQSGGQSYMMDPHGNYVPITDMSNPGMPGYTSTPYSAHQHHPMPQGQLAQASPLNAMRSSIVPSGTVLDDPHIPPPGGTLVRSTVDQKTGAQVNQTVWADSKRDPTDPPPGDHNPQITRKTIVRVTTKDTTDGKLPSAPDPSKTIERDTCII